MVEIFCIRDRIPTDEEVVSFYHMVFAPDQTDWNFYDPPEEITQKTDEEFVHFFREISDKNKRNYGFWAKAGDQIVGMAGINQFEEAFKAHSAELGFGVSKDYQRQGIGYRLVCAAVEKARGLGLKRLESDCFADNARAIALLQKSGFVKEGIRKGAVQRDGCLRDLCLFGLLLHD